MGVPLRTNSPPYDDSSIPFPPSDWMRRDNPTPNQILFSEAVYQTTVITMHRGDHLDAQNLNLIERYFDLLQYTFETLQLDDAVVYLQTFDNNPWPHIAQFIKEERHLCPVPKCTYFCISHFITSLQRNLNLRQLGYPDLGPDEEQLTIFLMMSITSLLFLGHPESLYVGSVQTVGPIWYS